MPDEKLLDFPGLERNAKRAKAEPTKVGRLAVVSLARGVLDLIEHIRLINTHFDTERRTWAAEIITLAASVREAETGRRAALNRTRTAAHLVADAAHDLTCATLPGGTCTCWKAAVSDALAESSTLAEGV